MKKKKSRVTFMYLIRLFSKSTALSMFDLKSCHGLLLMVFIVPVTMSVLKMRKPHTFCVFSCK